jgi:hypothetical protein
MSRRPFPPASDSLELTLGCMWDNFGNIILIALLVTVLARETKISAKAAGGTDLAQHRAAQALADARAAQADLAAAASDPALSQRLQLLAHRQSLRQESDRQRALLQIAQDTLATNATTAKSIVLATLRQAQADLQTAQHELAQRREQGDSLFRSIDQEQKLLDQKQRELTAANARHVQHLRLPREHPTSKTHLYIIARYGRLYPLLTFRDGEAQRNTATLNWVDEPPSSKRVDPKPDQGLAVTGDSPALTRFFQQFPDQDVYLVFQVYEDSFAAFNAAKRAAVAAGLEYTWEPRRPDEVLRLGPGARPPPPQ